LMPCFSISLVTSAGVIDGSYQLFIFCIYFGGAGSETACCGMGTQGFSRTELCVQQKVCSFGSFKILSLFLLDCPALLMDEMAPSSEHPDH
jgi:hypothetical protein